MDRKETEFRAEEPAAGHSRQPDSIATEVPPEELDPKTVALMRQGEELFSRGLYHQSIHVWTRILFLDRGNPEARLAIEKAKKILAERQRRVDLETAEAARLVASGNLNEARARLRAILALDPSHPEAMQISAKIDSLTRRSEPPRGAEVSEPPPADPPSLSKGIVVRVPKGRRAEKVPVSSDWKMTAFIAIAFVAFALGAFYLYQNWDAIVSDGAFGRAATSPSSGLPEREALPVPSLSELRYYNGSRLFAQGRYREALLELSRVERDSPVSAEVRSLVLRIEERLLRSSSDPEGSISEPPADPELSPKETATSSEVER